MPSHSVKQAKVMSAIAHGWHPSQGSVAKIPKKVAVEFHDADAGHKYGHGMDKKAKALRATKHYRKAYGGSVEGDGKDDTSYGGTLPRVLQPMTTHIPESWTRPPVNPPPKYAEGGDTLSDADQAAMMPETFANPLVRQKLGQTLSIPQRLIDSATQATPGLRREDVTDNPYAPQPNQPLYDASTETAMQAMGNAASRPTPGVSGSYVAPGMAPWIKEFMEKNPTEKAAVAAPKAPIKLDYEQMGNGKYEVFDPVTGKTSHTVDTLAEAKSIAEGKPKASDEFRNYASQQAEEFRKANTYNKLLDPRETARTQGGYETPAYRGLHLYKGEPNPVHQFQEGGDYHYSTANPDLADMYASYLDKHPGRAVPEGTFGEGAQVMPLYLNTKDYHHYDAGGGRWQVHNNLAIQAAQAEGKPGVVVHNVWDEPNSTKNLPSPNKVFITFPSGASTVKSRFAAKFDKSSPNIMHGVVGIGGPAAGYVAMSHSGDNEEPKMASGGKIDNFNPERGAAFGLARQGMIHSAVPGRTDKLNMNVPSGSYIIPADIPGAIGQGNSVAGGGILDKMFTKGPYGMNLSKSTGPRVAPRASSLRMASMHMRQPHFAKGGPVGKVTPIVAAGGEYVLHPDTVAELGHGDITLGHKILDAFVKHVRAKHITTLKGLKPPKGSK